MWCAAWVARVVSNRTLNVIYISIPEARLLQCDFAGVGCGLSSLKERVGYSSHQGNDLVVSGLEYDSIQVYCGYRSNTGILHTCFAVLPDLNWLRIKSDWLSKICPTLWLDQPDLISPKNLSLNRWLRKHQTRGNSLDVDVGRNRWLCFSAVQFDLVLWSLEKRFGVWERWTRMKYCTMVLVIYLLQSIYGGDCGRSVTRKY